MNLPREVIVAGTPPSEGWFLAVRIALWRRGLRRIIMRSLAWDRATLNKELWRLPMPAQFNHQNARLTFLFFSLQPGFRKDDWTSRPGTTMPPKSLEELRKPRSNRPVAKGRPRNRKEDS